MSLFDTSFLKFDGTPDTGRIPVRLVVGGSGRLSAGQLRDVAHVYDNFRTACKLSASDFNTEQIVMPDGTRVHLWSLQNRDEVTVIPAEDDGEVKLPHGFAVVTNWQSAVIYRRDLNESAVRWIVSEEFPPQVDIESVSYDNQAFRDSDPSNKVFINWPMVYRSSMKILWDYAMRGGADISSFDYVLPFWLKNPEITGFSFEPPHYAVDNTIIDPNGTALYTMVDATIILSPSAMDYPEPIHYLPQQTDAQGNQIALNQFRYAVLSPTANIWKFRFANERLQRISDTEYEALERNVQDIITPFGNQTTTTLSTSDSNLGSEDPAAYFKFKGTFDYLPGAYSGGGYGGRLFYIGWAGPDQWIDITGVNVSTDITQALREIKTQSGSTATISKVLAVPLESSTGHIDVECSLNYPATVLWRGGLHSKSYYPEDLKTLLGIPLASSLPLHYKIDFVAIYRYDTSYDVDGAPAIVAKLGWKDVALLEGTTTGRMSGKEYTNQMNQQGTYPHIDATWSYTWITTEIKTVSDFPYHPTNQYYLDWMDAANVKDEYYDDYLAYGTLPHGAIPAPNPTTKYEYTHNDRPENTVDYSLTSRYVIDYDHKGRFYAAIRCEVVCAGAKWKEDLASYKGYMAKDADPTYTVKIWFECNWNGVSAQQLLVEETVTRPCFEAVTISKFNPWYWHLPAYYDRDCKVRTPPEPSLDERFMMQFKNLASHQGVNTRLCCADVRPDITGADISLAQSQDGIEFSYEKDGAVIPHAKYVTGQLYARTFKLSDIEDALWLLLQLKCNAVEDNFQPIDGPTRPSWFYHPAIKAALSVDRHIEVRDGIIVQWSDDIHTDATGYPPTEPPLPDPVDRTIQLYRV